MGVNLDVAVLNRGSYIPNQDSSFDLVLDLVLLVVQIISTSIDSSPWLNTAISQYAIYYNQFGEGGTTR